MGRKTKGLFSVMLAALLLSLTACGGSPGKGPGQEAAPDIEEISKAAPEPEAEAFRPVIGLTTDSDYHYDEGLNAVVNRMETHLAGVDAATSEACPGLAAALDRLRESALSTEREAFQEREAIVSEMIADGGAGYELYGEMRSLVRRADAQVVSVVNAWSEYAGGVHESYGYAPSNFDASTGAEIALETLLTPEGKLTLNSRLGEELDALYPDIAPGAMVADYLTDDYAFSLEPDGVTFWFNPYEIASYADGLLTVKLYFDRDADILNGAYKGQEEAWFVDIGNEIPYRFAGSGGTFRTAEFWEIRNSDYPDWRDGFGLEFDAPEGADRWISRPAALNENGTAPIPEGRNIVLNNSGGFEISACYAHIPEGDYVIALLTMENDAGEMIVYSADGALVQELFLTWPDGFWYPEPPEDADDWSAYNAYQFVLTDPYKMPLVKRVDLFGTWSAEGDYYLTAAGVQPEGKLLYNARQYELTLKQDLTVTRCPSDSWVDIGEEEATLPAGTVAQVAAVTETLDRAFFRVPALNDGAEFVFSLSYDNDEWPRTVNGVNEEDIFDGLMYAG